MPGEAREAARWGVAAIALLAVACRVPERPPPAAMKLHQLTASAATFDVDRRRLEPRWVAREPSVDAFRGESSDVRVSSESACDGCAPRLRVEGGGAVAGFPVSLGVEYVVRVRTLGPAVVQLRGVSDESPERPWDLLAAQATDAEVEHEVRTAGTETRLDLRVAGAEGAALVTRLEIREASHLGLLQVVPAEAVLVRGRVHRPLPGGGVRSVDSLLVTGESRLAWTLPDGGGAWRLRFETAIVPRHGDEHAAPIELDVEVDRADGPHVVFKVERGAGGAEPDDGAWRTDEVDLAGARAVRLVSHGAGPTVTAAWGAPIVYPSARVAHPDVLVATADALRADHVGAYGPPGAESLTPHLDAMARAGALFDEARAQRGETWESLTSLAYASTPETVGAWDRGQLPTRGVRAVADAFGDAGYLTARVGVFHMAVGQFGAMDVEEDTTGDDETRARLDALFATPGMPVYAQAHLSATHYPYNPTTPTDDRGPMSQADFAKILQDAHPPPEELARLELRYRQCVRETDARLGPLVERLSRDDRPGGRALVVVAADHGSHQGEHDLWFLHSTLYRAALHVPLILTGPGIHAGAREGRLVRLMDVGPTLLDYAGLAPEPSFEGRTLRPLVDGRPEPHRVNVVAIPSWGMTSVETDDYHLIANPRGLRIGWAELGDRFHAMPRTQLYRWREDPDERSDLSGREPIVAGELWRIATSGGGAAAESMVAPEARRLLQQAGYAAPAR